MIKYIEAPDIHADGKWIDVTIKLIEKIEETAEREEVDFVVHPGDLHNSNSYIKKEYNMFRAAMRSLLKKVPCCAVVGTPGHETESMYGPLEDLGLVLLRPGIVYGYWAGQYHNIEPITIKSCSPSAILFGIPELTKGNIQATLGLSAEKANAEVEKTLLRYINEWMAPTRAQFPVPAICLMHGTISDYSRENEIDEIKKATSIVIHTEDLEFSGIDRWSLGHIHKPWESKKICAGYAGSWAINWGETDFVPGMNMVEIVPSNSIPERLITSKFEPTSNQFFIKIDRIAYGTPERKKIRQPLDDYDPAVAYWLDTDDLHAKCPDGHPWSKVTHHVERKQMRRVTSDQAKDATLCDLFLLADPKVEKETLALVKELETLTGLTNKEPRKIIVDSVEIAGCVFWKGRTIKLDLTSLQPGLTQIIADNGGGKSSLAAWVTPYPISVGKTPKSGRQSAIKDFFSEPESWIKKTIMMNGQKHEHLITIKGVHTQTPKVECSLAIDGKQQLDKATFDEMMAKCEELYGSFIDYFLTSFYVQPLQGYKIDGKIREAALMSATTTDIRDLVLSISGIDREGQKRIALDNVSKCEREIEDKETWLKGAEAFAIDEKSIKDEIFTITVHLAILNSKLTEVVSEGKEQKKHLDDLIVLKNKNDLEIQRQIDNQKKHIDLSNQEESLSRDIFALRSIAGSVESNKKKLEEAQTIYDSNISRKEIINENAERRNRYFAKVNEYNKQLAEIQDKIKTENNMLYNDYHYQLNEYKINKENLESTIRNAYQPCEHCGKIPYVKAEERFIKAKIELSKLQEPVEPEYELIPDSIPGIDKPINPVLLDVPTEEKCIENISELKMQIERGIGAEATIKANQSQIEKIKKELSLLDSACYNIDPEIDRYVAEATSEREKLQTQYTSVKAEISAAETMIAEKKRILSESQKHKEEMHVVVSDIKTLSVLLDRWKYIATMLQASKIPAMELDLVLDRIDTDVTCNIEPYLDGRYSFTTRTQKQGKKNVVDEFEIIVHDNVTGEDKSFIDFSPGQKAFLNDAYVKALISIRNERAHITYSPIIYDEADNPIQDTMVSQYYDMQSKYYQSTDVKVLVISQSPDAHNFIANSVEIKELLG